MASNVQSTTLTGLSGVARRLVAEGALSESDARKASEASSKQRVSLIAYLIENGLADPKVTAAAASQEFGVPLFDASSIDLKQAPIKAIEQALMEKHRAVPLYKRGNRMFIGIADPTNDRALEEIKFQSKTLVEPIIVDDNTLTRLIEQALSQNDTAVEGMEDAGGLENLDVQGGDDDMESTAAGGVDVSGNDDTPVVRFINKVLVDAIKRGASDIHFEPYENVYRVRFRMDGILKQVASAPVKLSARMAARLKVMSSLDIAEKRVPQDGRIKLNLSKTKAVDFRVSTCPTLFGENSVIRILDPSSAKLGIDALGYEAVEKERLLAAIGRPYGMVLVTGPTGSGKTVSLYTCLNLLNKPGVNIATAEDPSEINLPGVNQVNVNEKAGLTFAVALKSFLRQDPDIIMVGEIRDLETADISIKAAQTGHLVLSTLHTNDAPTTLTRMRNMGIAPFNIASSVILITAQRLARRLCPICKTPADIPHEALVDAGFPEDEIDGSWVTYRPVGCSACNNGYKGRLGIYQVMPITEEIQRIIPRDGSALEIAEQAKLEGVRSLRDAGLHKAKLGLTSLEEVLAVTNE